MNNDDSLYSTLAQSLTNHNNSKYQLEKWFEIYEEYFISHSFKSPKTGKMVKFHKARFFGGEFFNCVAVTFIEKCISNNRQEILKNLYKSFSNINSAFKKFPFLRPNEPEKKNINNFRKLIFSILNDWENDDNQKLESFFGILKSIGNAVSILFRGHLIQFLLINNLIVDRYLYNTPYKNEKVATISDMKLISQCLNIKLTVLKHTGNTVTYDEGERNESKLEICVFLVKEEVFSLYKFSNNEFFIWPSEPNLNRPTIVLACKFINQIKKRLANKAKRVTFSKDLIEPSSKSRERSHLLKREIDKETISFSSNSKENSEYSEKHRCNICKKKILAIDYLNTLTCQSISCISIQSLNHESKLIESSQHFSMCKICQLSFDKDFESKNGKCRNCFLRT